MTAPRMPHGPSLRVTGIVLVALLLAACAEQQPRPAPPAKPADRDAASGKPARKPWKPLGPYTPGGLYAPGVADGAPDVPPDIAKLPEPVPHPEPLSRYGNRSPYSVLGKSYSVLPSASGYVERGMASWYGTKFDGRVTSSFEPYDLAQFTAAHKTLPLPSYARVTNLENGRSVIVRINDRGPFHEGRLIDLSYAAAIKLGVNVHGTAMVEVRGIDTGRPLPASDDEPDTVAAQPAPPRPVPARPKPVAARPAPARVAPPAATATPSDDAADAADSDATAAPLAAVPSLGNRSVGGLAATVAGDPDSAASKPPAPAMTLPLPPPADAAPVAALPAGSAPADARLVSQPAVAAPVPTAESPVATSPPPTPTPSATPAAPPGAPASALVASINPPPARSALPGATPGLMPAPGRPPVDPETLGFLQLASFGDRANAEHLMQRLQQAGVEHAELVSVQVSGQTLWRVHIGPLRALEADGVAAHLDELGFGTPPFFKE